MVIVVYKKPTNEIRGKTRKYLIECDPNVFCGEMSSISRKELWKQICNDGIDAIMIYSAKNEQGFEVLKANKGSTYNLININGLIFSSRKISFGIDCVYAKPEKLLIDHMIETGTVAERLMNYGRANSMIKALSERINISSEILVSSIAWLCAMHDIGKCHVLFQQELGKVNPSIIDLLKRLNLNVDDNKTIRHERYSMYIVQDYFLDQFGYDYDSDIDDFAAIIAYHHQGKGSTGDAFHVTIPDVAEVWKQVQMEIIEEINNRWKFDEELLKNRRYRNGFTTCILSIMITSDWITSGNEWAKLISDKRGKSISDFVDCFIDKNMLGKIDFCTYFKNKTFEELFDGKTPRTMQKMIIDIVNETFDLLLVEAPCGNGKTEAAIYAAIKMCMELGKSGIYFAMPDTTTADSMTARVRQFMHSNGFEHAIPEFTGKAFWSDDKEDNIDHEIWTSASRHKLLYPVAVGTIDQLFKSIGKYRYSAIQLMGLSDKVVIIDEVHSYDAYMRTEIERLLDYCKMLKVPVIMLSATLSTRLKEGFIGNLLGKDKIQNLSEEYPLLTVIKENELIETSFETQGKDVEVEITEVNNLQASIIEFAEQYKKGCILCMLPTVDQVIDTYKQLETKNKILYHARDTLKAKKKKAENIITMFGEQGKKQGSRPLSSICIATNIIQKSLDIDFDTAASCIAPGDDLIQEIGREQRHGHEGTIRESENVPLKITIYKPVDYESLAKIYNEAVLDETYKVFKQISKFHTVKDVRKIIDRIYNENVWEQLRKEDRNLRGKASREILDEAYATTAKNTDILGNSYVKYWDTNITTRESSYPTGKIAIVPSDILQGEAFEVAKKINLEYTITIPQYVIDHLNQSEVTNNPFLSDVRVYISEDGSIKGDKYYLQLTELGLEIQCNKNK